MQPYYQDECVTLYNCDAFDGLRSIQGKVDALVTDPPYFKVKNEQWDRQWKKKQQFLGWMAEWMDITKPLLNPHASVWVFASPAMTTSVESVVNDKFRVLNTVRWIKREGYHRKVKPESQRQFLSPWEGIVFAEQYDDVYGEMAKALRKEVFAPVGRYLQTEWESAGWKAGKLGVALGRDSALPTRWAEGSSLPNPVDYEKMRALLNADGGNYLRREYEDLRRPFKLTSKEHNSDIWEFKTVPHYKGKHPCEKPLPLMEHIIATSTRQGEVVLDPFAGSASTLVAARNLGRKAIGFEIDASYCERAAQRLANVSLTNSMELV